MAEDDEAQESRYIIPKEDVIEQRTINFMGDEIIAALTISGVYLTLPGMCTAMGLGTNGQIRRCINTNKLRVHLRSLDLITRAGVRETTCLLAEQVPMWLIGVESSRAKLAFQEKIDLYHDRLAPVALAVFQDVMEARPIVPATQTPAIDSRMASMLDQFETLVNVAMDVRAHLDTLTPLPGQVETLSLQLDQALNLLTSLAGDSQEAKQEIERIKAKTAGLTASQARAVKEMISHMVDVTEGTPGELKHATIYGRIQHRFRVNTYSKIPEDHFEELMQYLRDELQRATDGESPEQGSLF